jgi:hypothetical protein
MFILDNLVKSPFNGFMFIAREVANAVQKEQENKKLNLMSELTELHMRLEKGEIDDNEFDEQEAFILDQLESLESED